MSDTHVRDGSGRRSGGGDTIVTFAARVLDVLVDRNRRATSTLRADLVVSLADGMGTQDQVRINKTLGDFRRACISPVAMTEVYVPAASRYLGEQWANDRLCFADVTIAVARLQALVRAIGTRWGGDPSHVPGRASILMVVPAGENHTLGAVVATEQLRRMGMSVCLRMGATRTELVDVLRRRKFDAAMVSVGHDHERIDVARKLVDVLRAHGARRLPIVAGGAAADFGADASVAIGADFVTSDLSVALNRLGLVAQPEPEISHAGFALPSF